ncbi:MAG TPA: hypothetical protein VLO07_01720, partial [Thermoanaerobaculia bacterium]|nr:hypothetical protein [Thermoanaerobaculia bacterium]
MEPVSRLRRDTSRAVGFVAAGIASLVAALFGGGFLPRDAEWVAGAVGFVGFVLCLRRALVLWRVDERVYDHRQRPFKSVLGVAILTAAVSSASGQQTIFNVPTADVLDRGKLYSETDWLWRPTGPRFVTGSLLRGVYGFGGNVEGGINFAGFNTPGRSVPTAAPNVKWRPYRSDVFTVTTGASGVFFLRGVRDGAAGAMGYAHGAVKLATGTRLTAGGWWASSHYAGPGAEKGGLFGVEQPIASTVTLAADWYTGRNGLGYASPGVIVTA